MESQEINRGLERNALSLFDAVMAGLAQMAPAFSILFTAAFIAGIAGASVPLVFLLATIGILATGNALAQFSREWPSAGSFVTFIARAIGPRVSLVVAITALLGYIIAFGGVYIFVGDYIVNEVFGDPGIPLFTQFITIMFGALVTLPVILGVRVGVRVAVAMYLFEVAVFAVFTIAVLVQGGATGLSLEPFALPAGGLGPIALGFALAVLAFVGFEAPAPLAEETRDPRRNVPIALMACILINGALYVLASYALVAAFGNDGTRLGEDSAPFVTASQEFIAPLALIVVWILLSSVVGSYVAANTETARVIYNTAREGLLARSLARLHPRYRTPWLAAIAFVAPSVLLGVGSTIFTDPGTASGFLGTLGTLGIIVMYAMTNVALIVHWARQRASGGRRRVFSWLIVPLAGVAILGVPLWYNLQPGQDPPFNLMPVLLPLLILVSVAYMLYVQRSKPQLLARAGSIMMGESTSEESFQSRSEAGAADAPGENKSESETTVKEDGRDG